MKIATAGSARSKRWRTQDTTWDAVLTRLRAPLRTGETFAEYQRMDKEEKDKKKGAAGGFVGGAMKGGRRVAGAVYERWLITLDADEAGEGDWEDATALCDFALCAYTTHSHAPDSPRLRWVVPLRRPVSREEYEPLARKVAEQLGVLETLDPSTYQPERLMYWATCAQDGEYKCLEQDGSFLDPAALLAEYGPGDAWRDVTAWPMASRERDVVRRELRRQADPTTKPGLVGAFCRTYDVHDAIAAFLPQVYESAGEGRYTYTGGSTSAGAVVYGDGLYLYSNHATDPAWGQLCNAFDLVRLHRFGDQDAGKEELEGTALPSYKAMCAWAAGLDEVKLTLVTERMESAGQDFADMGEVVKTTEDSGVSTIGGQGDLRGEAGHASRAAHEGDGDAPVTQAQGSPPVRDMSWVSELKVNHKSGEADPTIGNAKLILEHDPRLAGKFAFNRFSARPVLRGDVPWRRPGSITDPLNGEPWTDGDDAGLRLYLEQTWKLKGRQSITDAWSVVMEANTYHPVQEYLEGLHWDEEARLDTMLVRWMGAEDTPYVRAVTRKWMCAAVARIFRPGHKFDNMLVLVGAQGIGKSRLAKALSRGWFTDSLSRMDGKEAYESLRGVWIVELAELAAARRSEVEVIKNFISKQEDMYRPAYGRHTVVYPRQCVCYGTTNDPDFLKDRSGNRRFWPVHVTGLDHGRLTGLEDEVGQLWAEAVVRWRAGEALWMDDPALMSAAVGAQEEFTVADEMTGMVEAYLETPLPVNWEELGPEDRRDYILGRSLTDPSVCTLRRDVVSIPEIRVELMGESRLDIGSNDGRSRRIGDIMNNMAGWKRTGKLKRLSQYGPQRVYVRIGGEGEDWLAGQAGLREMVEKLRQTDFYNKARKDDDGILD